MNHLESLVITFLCALTVWLFIVAWHVLTYLYEFSVYVYSVICREFNGE